LTSLFDQVWIIKKKLKVPDLLFYKRGNEKYLKMWGSDIAKVQDGRQTNRQMPR
jgi:hypothetical protein